VKKASPELLTPVAIAAAPAPAPVVEPKKVVKKVLVKN
jgi:hypothetical protein